MREGDDLRSCRSRGVPRCRVPRLAGYAGRVSASDYSAHGRTGVYGAGRRRTGGGGCKPSKRVAGGGGGAMTAFRIATRIMMGQQEQDDKLLRSFMEVFPNL